MPRPEIPLYRRRLDQVRGYVLAVTIAVLLAAAICSWGDSVNWGLQ